MSLLKKILFITIFLVIAKNGFATTDTRLVSTTPKEIYGQNQQDIKIKIGNGGAGATGILRALAEDYLQESGKKYAIAWYQDVSINNLQQLKNGVIDIALVYEKSQGQEAQKEGFATNYTVIFNDHFLIVGPKSNSAKIAKSDSLKNAFKKVAALGEKTSNQVFLSRDDNSGTNIKERSIWEMAGLKPWQNNSSWYFKHHAFPKDALLKADENLLYTITDWGTWLSNKDNLSNLEIYMRGGETLLNPCFALLGKDPTSETLQFLNYLKSERAQKLIADFGKDKYAGSALFTPSQQLDFAVENQNK